MTERNFIQEREHQRIKEIVAQANKTFPKVAGILMQESMHVQCNVISELMGVFLGGIPPHRRAAMFKILVEGAIDMIEVHDGYSQ